MRHLDFNTSVAYVEILPGAISSSPNCTLESKIESAIARLGEKWVLAATRAKQIQKLKTDGMDLV